jgi:hypothetical protein
VQWGCQKSTQRDSSVCFDVVRRHSQPADATTAAHVLVACFNQGHKQVRLSDSYDSFTSLMRGISSSYMSSTCTAGNVLRNCTAR